MPKHTPTARQTSDRRALDAIARILQDPDWAPGMLEDIAEIADAAGCDTAGDGSPTWDRH